MSRRLTIPEAADALGLTETAVRQRVTRGTLPTERQAGRVYVLVDGVTPPLTGDPLVSPVAPDESPADPTDARVDTPSVAPAQPATESAQNRALDALEGLLRDTLREKDAAQQAAALYMERSRNLEAEVERLAGQVEELLSLPAHEEPRPAWWRRLFRR